MVIFHQEHRFINYINNCIKQFKVHSANYYILEQFVLFLAGSFGNNSDDLCSYCSSACTSQQISRAPWKKEKIQVTVPNRSTTVTMCWKGAPCYRFLLLFLISCYFTDLTLVFSKDNAMLFYVAAMQCMTNSFKHVDIKDTPYQHFRKYKDPKYTTYPYIHPHIFQSRSTENFLSEFFHPDHHSDNTKVVILHNQPPSNEFLNILHAPQNRY